MQEYKDIKEELDKSGIMEDMILMIQQNVMQKLNNADNNQNINDRYNQSSHDVASKIQPSAPDPKTNKDLQYIGGLDWGQKPVHQWYGKYPNEPHKVVDYNVTDQGALNGRQRKVLLSKEE
ncbi:MAG: hypothetical protein EZS28_045780 [Streblomastix strix]|uniref:Uncharacterized protein n=1 Tax=Streblomastix strix TaxID=222440 RepID=A0A5J4TLR5_9EUKA|nr:MAG: hypothetical protein EZS28_045780 [Streblomastix strix]